MPTQYIVSYTMTFNKHIEHFHAKFKTMVCHVHMYIVLSTLYQEEMVTEHEMENLKQVESPWNRLVQTQRTKPPDVVKRTAELLTEVGLNEHAKRLKG